MLLYYTASALASAVLVSAAPLIAREVTCAPQHIIVARASFEPAGTGILLRPLMDEILDAFPSATYEAIDYPASVEPYDWSSGNGTIAVTNQLTAYVNACPDSQIVLLGYSQGAQIVLDSLCGGGGYKGLAPANGPIDTVIGDHVTAIIQMGDPRHMPNMTYDVGTATLPGSYPRILPEQNCDYYANRIQSYCDWNDLACASGWDPLIVHATYPLRYDGDALKFVSCKLNKTC